MSFHGFTKKTLEYFLSICLDNSKSHFETNRALYNEHVKIPLRALHDALVPVMLEIDKDLCVKPSRCVSGAYNDARFAKSDPIKTYMYIHFCAEASRETDIPGFFIDASYDGYRYGLQLYHKTTQGMTKLREAALKHEAAFSGIIGKLDTANTFKLEGDRYKKDHFPEAPAQIKSWLNCKSWWIGRNCPMDEAFFTQEIATQLSDGFKSLKDLYYFISAALATEPPLGG